jgi:hypothetical protein
MKSLSLISALLFTIQLSSQSFNCDQYRKEMDEEMDALGYTETDRMFIIGKNGEYYKTGMSDLFVSEPKVPDFGELNAKRNPHIVAIEIAHVNLYHCDLVEKELIKQRSSSKVENEVEVTIFPNPSSGNINVQSKEQIIRIVVFNSSGSLMHRIEQIEEQINLAKLTKGVYYLQISTHSGNTIKRVILE